MKTLAKVVVCLLLVAGMAYAQGVGASGSLSGTVTDPNGAVLTNTNITVTDSARGIKRTAVTDGTGHYSVPSLSPATYDVTVEHSGFQTLVQKGVVVNVGQTVVLDFRMKVSAAAETVEVTTEPPLVETERSSQSDTVNQQYIQDLPINRRDYLTFTLLMPGVSDSTRLASDQDFRVRQTPQSGLSFYGSNGRGNNITVDGGEANDDAGGVRLTVSQEAVQEFQINRSNYSPEFGAASGAAVNIVTKSGTNNLHGSLFAFFRNDRFDARNPLAYGAALAPGQTFFPLLPDLQGTAVKDKLSRQQFGGSVGFSTNKDKSFFYLAYEGLRNSDQSPVPLLINTEILRPNLQQKAIINGLAGLGAVPVPCLTGAPALPAAVCAAVLTNALTVSPVTGLSAGQTARNIFAIHQLENNGGLVPFSDTSDLGVFRFDHRFSDRNQVFIRYNGGRDDSHNPNTQALTGLSRGDVTNALDNTVLASWFHVFSPTKLNEARVQWNLSHFDVVSNDALGPGIDINGFATLGRNIFLPSFTTMRRYDFADNFTLIHGRHTFKMGADFLLRGNKSESHTFLAGRFVFGNLPGGILSPCLQVPAACGLTTPATTLNSLQSLSLGAPLFYQQGFGNPTVASNNPFFAGYVQDTFAFRPNLTFTFGLRYELDQRYEPLNTDHDNFAPRVAFAWDPWKDHKTVVRGGYGIFYSPTYYQIDYVVRALGIVNGFRQIAQVFVPLNQPGPVNAATIFQTLFAQGVIQQANCGAQPGDGCITPANLTQFGINITHTGPVPPLSVVFGGQPDYQNPYSQQAEFGVERELFPGWSVAGTFIYAHTLRLPRSVDTNLLPTAPITPVGPALIPTQNWGAPACVLNPFLCFANPLRLQNNIYTSNAAALYHAGIFELKKRFSHHYSLMVNYTYSKAQDDSTDYNSDYAAFNQVNLAAERSLSDFDQRHKVVVAAVLESPWKGGAGASLFDRIFTGFTLSPIFRYNSGHPWNLLAGSDINGDRHSTNDRPAGDGRNTGKGPNYFSWDMRLMREFRFGDKASLQIMAEGFNILNRTNTSAVNNVVGSIAPPFNFDGTFVPGGAGTCQNPPFAGFVPNNPCTFTAANPARQVQIGLHFSF